MTPAYATIRRRLLAAFLDFVLLSVAISGLAAVTGDSNSYVVPLYYLLLASLAFNYFGFCEWRWGKTIGKTAVGIKVVGVDGEPPGWSRATIRNIFLLVDIPLCLLVFGAIFWWHSERKQRLGDRIARTVVVHTSARAVPVPPPGRGPIAKVKPAAASPPSSMSGGAWTPWHVVAGIVTLLVLLSIEIGIVAAFDPDLKSLAATLVAQLLLAATLVGVAFFFAKMPKPGWASREWLGLRPVRVPTALKWGAAAMGIYFVFAVAYSLIVNPHQEDIARELGFGSSIFGAIAAGVLIIVAAPVSEEIFFRGFVFGGLRRHLPFWPAGIIAGAIFGVFHFTGIGEVGVIPQLAVLGLILCWLYEKTGSIYPTIAVHMLNNTLAFIVIATS